jgi:hypothetical protein
MTTTSLFDTGGPPPEVWTTIGTSTHGLYLHNPSGWRIVHCGHPTALWPYYAKHPDYRPSLIDTGGRAFAWLERARQAVEHLLTDPEQLALFARSANNYLCSTLPFDPIDATTGRRQRRRRR